MKSLLQRAVAVFPSDVSFDLYYAMQRTFGSLRRVNPIVGFEDGLRLIAATEAAGGRVEGKVFLEVGTGRRLNVPIALWLCGAAQTITVDRNPYLKAALIREDLEFIRNNRDKVKAVFGGRADNELFQRRLAMLAREGLDVAELLEIARIIYLAPQRARALPLADGSVDYHVSNNVLEHIEPDVVRAILREGKRVLRAGGLLVHRVDFSDHFSEVDGRISTVNFLRYSEGEWQRYGGNRYNYHNRLRIDEIERIVSEAGLVIAGAEPHVDVAAMRVIASGFALDPRFAAKTKEVNATESAVMMLALPGAWTPGRASERAEHSRV